MKKIFDIGMYDGADTAYYLECGYQIIAVEANPALVDDAKRRFEAQIASGLLTVVNAAISSNGETVELNVCVQDPGASSIFSNKITHRVPMGAITVPGVTLQQLFESYGVPEYLKVDIEGADRLCVLALTSNTRPKFLSFEVSEDIDELLSYIETIGYQRFKIINQNSFRELANQRCLYDLVARQLMRYMGYREPQMVRRSGRFFVSGHSSGPLPWHSDGRWRTGEATRTILREAKASNTLRGWYDIHTMI